ncbi:MAG: M20 family peptidase [Anaerolineaceae bacterium]|nr:M20 family peptidase [Anaerolineaceae bacterium]
MIFFYILLGILVVLIAVLLFRTMQFSKPPLSENQLEEISLNTQSIAEHLSEVIQIQTISHSADQPPEKAVFEELHQKLERMFPETHKNLKLEKINQFSLLFTWTGSQPDLEPILFMAHQDVVPADPATLDAWDNPPFSGKITDKYIYGRGTLDIKNQMIASMEAVEYLLSNGFQPKRSIMLAFGHDEEIGGPQGARKIVEHLKEKGVHLAAVIDEGGAIIDGTLPGLNGPSAMVGNVEKGYLTLNLSIESEPGHSSSPPPHTAIGILAKAITLLEANPLPADINAIKPLFENAAPFMSFGLRMVLANLWLFGDLVLNKLNASPQTAAMVRTTTAVTIIKGGIKDNILPREAVASVNFRILPGDTVDSVVAYVRRVINNDDIQIDIVKGNGWNPSHISPTDSTAFDLLRIAILDVFGNIPVAPYLVGGATDSRYFYEICDHVYRFSPLIMPSEDLGSIHGINERISLENMSNMVKYFIHLIKLWEKQA